MVIPLRSVPIRAHLDSVSSFTYRTPDTGKTPIAMGKFCAGPPPWSRLEHLTCKGRLRVQGSFGLEKRRLWGGLSAALQYLREGCHED